MDNKTIEDLLADDGFMAWYHQSDKEMVDRWNKWIGESEQNRLLAEEAAFSIRLMGAMMKEKEEAAPREQADVIWGRIKAAIHEEKGPVAGKPVGIGEPAAHVQVGFGPSWPVMLRNYGKVGLRNISRNRVSSFINIFGLALGMGVSMLIGLWIRDELSYNTYHENYDRIAQVFERVTANGEKNMGSGQPVPLAEELRRSYPGDFKYVTLVTGTGLTLSAGGNIFTEDGRFMEADAPEMLGLKMREGSREGLKDPTGILLSESTAGRLFGTTDPMGRMVRIDNRLTVKVTGVYEDLPYNTDFRDLSFIAPWSFFIANWDWIRSIKDDWLNRSPGLLVQLYPNADFDKVSEKIRDVMERKAPQKGIKLELFLHPMSKWHLYGDFKNGVNTGGLITFVWLFGTIGVFVLILACINFMNLSTARSEKRAKEVGIRKVMGSLRGQLIGQFLSESILMTGLALVLALLLVQLTLPWFNDIADKRLAVPWSNPWFWLSGLCFSLLTGLIAGSYPALYLSSFLPVRVLKGTFRAGRFSGIPRKVLVVLQFTVSVSLITGTIIVYRQIQFAKDRPVGYNRSGLISVAETTPEIYTNYDIIRRELLSSGAALEMAESQCPVTNIWAGGGGFDWKGKPNGFKDVFATVAIRHEFGKTVGWQFVAGRDFSKAFVTDSDGMVLNEAAVKYMGLKNPVGETVRSNNRNYKVLGVIRDMIMASPYQPVPQTIYTILREGGNVINIRMNPSMSAATALAKMGEIFKKYNPAVPFTYTFVDQDYAKKFGDEERIGKLALFFALLAIFISCLGLYGLTAFVAEQRTREIGIRKVLGASLFQVWRLLSKEFMILVGIALLIALPVAAYLMTGWLQRYQYRAPLSWWIFAAAGAGALGITIVTVSYQAIKAALLNPVKSLRTE